MKMLKVLLISFAGLFFVSNAQAQDEDLEALFNANCSELIDQFGKRPITYSYKNWQGLQVNNKVVTYQLTQGRCASQSVVQSIVAANADAPEMNFSYFGSISNGIFAYGPSGGGQDLGTCPYAGAQGAMAALRKAGVAIVPQVEIAITNSYRDSVCPALTQAIAAEIAAASQRVLAARRAK